MSKKHSQRLADLCRKHGIALAYLFGSQTRAGAKILEGEKVLVQDPLADLDIGIITEEPLPPPPQRHKFYARLYNEMMILRRSADFRPFLDKYLQEVLEEI